MLRGSSCVLDPFGGVGKIFLVSEWLPNLKIYATEIEPEWARANPNIIVANAKSLPYKDNFFDSICTSPTYGNRMADTLIDTYDRITYTSKLGRKLHKDNSGSMQWGKAYKDFHVAVWYECTRVLQEGGVFILNIKDHIRAGKVQHVTDWHIATLESIGYKVELHNKIDTPSMRFGENGEKRIEYESVIKLVLKSKSQLTKRAADVCPRCAGTGVRTPRKFTYDCRYCSGTGKRR